MLGSKTKKLAALDDRWFERFHQIIQETRETYIALMPPDDVLQQKRQAFEQSGFTTNPTLHATHLDAGFFATHNDKLHDLRHTLNTVEPNKYVRQTYDRCIHEAIAKNNLCIASAHGDDQEFRTQNFFAYGSPDPDIFRGAIDWIHANILATPQTSPTLDILKDNALALLPNLHGNTKQFLPSKVTYDRVRLLHDAPGGYLTKLFGPDGPPTQAVIDQVPGDLICQQVLKNIGCDYRLADSHDGLWGVVHTTKQVMRPPGYQLDQAEFVGIVCHEIGSHLLETVNGSRQPLRLLQTGLDRYEHGNEGRAVLREQIVLADHTEFLKHPAWEYAIIKHVLICLAEGLYQHPHAFAEVYALAFALFAFWRERRYPANPHNQQTARDEAWHVTVRILKGTAGQGGAYMKDIVYLEGNIRCWQVARTHPEMILYGDYGKFDIANPEHIKLLRRLKILRPFATTKSRLKSWSKFN
jgi:hypothetical protein